MEPKRPLTHNSADPQQCRSTTVNSEISYCDSGIAGSPICAGSSMPKTSALSHIEVGDSTYSLGDTVLVKGEKKQQFVSSVRLVQ